MALITEFLTGLRKFVLAQDGNELRNWLKVEPHNAGPTYSRLAQELKSGFPAGSDALEKLVDNCLPEEDDVVEGRGSPWPGLNSFIREYLEYWRDVDFNNFVKLYARLCDLLNSCANAFANPTYGLMLLQTSIAMSESLSRLVMNLNRQPDIVSQIQLDNSTEEGAERKSIVEVAADIIQKFFTTCLTDRASTRWTTPKGKKAAVYIFANTTLKLLFACDKSRLAVQMFTNLASQGPALSLYPASQRVTLLYYLGRFNFDHGHYLRAHMCFEEAYHQCLPRFLAHRRQIVTYWLPTNLFLGRFPNLQLLGRPEAAGLADVYLPVCAAIRSGNFIDFQHAMNQSRDYLWAKGFYLPMLQLKSLVWRSFTRKTFLITWQALPEAEKQKTAVLDLHDVVAAASYVQRLLEGWVPAKPPPPPPQPTLPAPRARPPHNINSIFLKAVTNNAVAGSNTSFNNNNTTIITTDLVPPPGGPRRLRPTEGLIFGNQRPDVARIEGVVAPLIYAGLLNGFIARAQQKFAIEGSKKTGGNPVSAGWPVPYQSILERFREDYDDALAAYNEGELPDHPGELDDVPGWVRDQAGVMGT